MRIEVLADCEDGCFLSSYAVESGRRLSMFKRCSLEISQTDFSLALIHRPDDGGSKYLRNVGKPLPGYTVLQPGRQFCSADMLIDDKNILFV
jgi:hypothetical protein